MKSINKLNRAETTERFLDLHVGKGRTVGGTFFFFFHSLHFLVSTASEDSPGRKAAVVK